MCGICGIVVDSRSTKNARLRETVEAMNVALRHRGPDGTGLWSDDASGVAMGHRRLAIIDLSASARQPMISANGRFVVVYNGEIYNYRELRSELELTGIRFRSQSDTEVLAEACAAWGVTATAHRLNGIFAFAAWDRAERQLTLVRDQLGVKPLYWAYESGMLLFGSELKALYAFPDWRFVVNRDALTAYFRFNYIPAPQTVFENVWKLLPGTVMTFRPGGTPSISEYWDLRQIAQRAITKRKALRDSTAIDLLHNLLRDAVRQQMIADVPLGAFLSGGVDSSSVVALMQSLSDRPIRTFTIGFPESNYNEAPYAAAVARHLGTDHTELHVKPRHVRDVIPRLPEFFDEPFADSSQIPTFLVSEMTRRHVTVALSGDGGDELFAGYNRYQFGYLLHKRLALLPKGARHLAAKLLTSLSPSAWDRIFSLARGQLGQPQAGDKLYKLAAVLRESDENALYRRLLSHWDAPETLVKNGRELRNILWDEVIAKEFQDFIERMQFLDTRTYLPDDILTKVDRASMAVSLEVRVPLLDPRVVELAWSLPRSLKLREGRGKWILRQMLYRYVPASLIERPKMGFAVPIDQWLRGPLREWAEDLLDEKRIREDGFIDPAPVHKIWREHLHGRRNWQHLIWSVLMFQAWNERWNSARRLDTTSMMMAQEA